MAITKGLFLTQIDKIGKIGDFSNFCQKFKFTVFLKTRLKFKVLVEMIFNRSFVPAGNNYYLLDSCLDCLLHYMLDYWLVNNRQHFLRLSLSCRQKSRPKPSRRYNYLSYFFGHFSKNKSTPHFDKLQRHFRMTCHIQFT